MDSVNISQLCSLYNPAESAQTVVMMSFAVLSESALQCGSSSGSKTPCSSWRVIRSHNSCMLTAAPPIKTGDLSGPCVWSVGELWPCKYASDTFAVPIIERQPICLVMHRILKAQYCAGMLLIPKPSGVTAATYAAWFCFVTTTDGKQTLCFPLSVVIYMIKNNSHNNVSVGNIFFLVQENHKKTTLAWVTRTNSQNTLLYISRKLASTARRGCVCRSQFSHCLKSTLQ